MHARWILPSAFLVLTANSYGCCKKTETTDPPTAVSVTEAPSVTAAPTGINVPAAPRRTLKAGKVEGTDVWMPTFDATRPDDAAGKAWLAARKVCADAGLEMCTETQWSHACHDDASLGTHAAWTVTASEAVGFVVRGGGGCEARTVAAGFETQPGRAVLCCTRAIGIRTANPNKAFLQATSTRIGKIEAALNRHDAAGVAAFFDDELRFYQSDVPRERAKSLMSGSFGTYPDQWAVHDDCDVSLQRTGDPETDTWTAECSKVVYRTGEVGVTRTVYVFGGPQTLLRSLTEPRVVRKWAPP